MSSLSERKGIHMEQASTPSFRPSPLVFQSKSTRTGLALLTVVALAISGYWGLSRAQADAATPSVDYQFNGTLTDSAAGSSLTVTPTCPNPVLNVPDNQCIATSAFGSDGGGPYWTWTAGSPTRRGGGFTVVTNSPLTKTYTIALKFSFASMPSGWAKIIDYNNKATDDGFYFKNGRLQFYPESPAGATYTANQVLDLVITRDDATTTKPFTVYARTPGGALQTVYQINDTSDLAVPATINAGANSVLGFFFDDNDTSAEATTGGKVYRLRTWNGVALTPSQVDAATSTTPSVATTTLANATVGSAYSATLSATGGLPPYANWQVTTGSLPAGLALAPSTGVISGTPTAVGTSNFSVTVADGTGTVTAPVALSLTVVNPPAPAPAPTGIPYDWESANSPDNPAFPRNGTSPSPSPSVLVVPSVSPSPSPASDDQRLDEVRTSEVATLPPGRAVMYVNGQPVAVSVTRLPGGGGVGVSGSGTSIILAGRGSDGQPLGLNPDGVLLLQSLQGPASAGLRAAAMGTGTQPVVEMRGDGYEPNKPVKLYLLSYGYMGQVLADSNGDFFGHVTMPAGISSGPQTLQANGYNPLREVRSLSLGVQVTGQASSQVAMKQASGVVLFAPGSTKVTKKSQAQVKAVLAKAGNGSVVRVSVVGYGPKVGNTMLAAKRAQAVADYLKSIGLTATITTDGSGAAKATSRKARQVVVTISHT